MRPLPPHLTEVTAFEWPVKLSRVVQDIVSHILTSPSFDELANFLDSGFLIKKN